jgi:hypothetical protein
MKKTLLTLWIVAALPTAVFAQDRIYRCGNEYTNNATQAKERGCKLVEGGNVTVIQGSRPSGGGGGTSAGTSSAAPSTSSASPAGAPRVSNNDQRARDSDARAILETELRKAEARHAELLKEYNGGAPERNALDLRNPQRYMERTAELKASVARSESDISGIKRELSRLPPAN